MNLQEFIRAGILDTLAELFNTSESATLLLDSLGFPQARRPVFPNSGQTLTYWREVANLIGQGVLSSGTDLQVLIDAALDFYPNNPRLKNYGINSGTLINLNSNPEINQKALQLWHKKLVFLQEQKALETDAAIKFKLQEQIEECLREIKGLGG
jgi:hypothetical protein